MVFPPNSYIPATSLQPACNQPPSIRLLLPWPQGFPFISIQILTGQIGFTPSPLAVTSAALSAKATLLGTYVEFQFMYDAKQAAFGFSVAVSKFSLQVRYARRCVWPEGAGAAPAAHLRLVDVEARDEGSPAGALDHGLYICACARSARPGPARPPLLTQAPSQPQQKQPRRAAPTLAPAI